MSKLSTPASWVSRRLRRIERTIRNRILPAMLAFAALCTQSFAQGPSTVGAWSAVDWQCDTISLESTLGARERMLHGALIPQGPYRGCVLTWGRFANRTATFLWNPSNPTRLYLLTNSWGGAPRHVDGAAMTWDDEGQLVIVGPMTVSGVQLGSTWRLFPNGLNYPPTETIPPTPCNQSFADVGGNAWRESSLVSVARHRPVLFMLANGLIPSSAIDKSVVLLGGNVGTSANDGCEFWQALSPRSSPGGSTWSSTFLPNIAHPHTDPIPNETYIVQNGLTESQVEAAPCALQLADAGQFPNEFVKSSFMAQDSLVTYATPPVSSHAPGLSTVVRPRYTSSPSSWEYWPRGSGGNFERSQGSAVLRHDLVGSAPGFTGKNRVISFGGVAYSSTAPGWYTVPGAQEYLLGSSSNPSQGAWVYINLQPVAPYPVGRIDNNAVVLPTGDILVVGGGRIPNGTNLPAGTTPDALAAIATPVHVPQLVRPALQGSATTGTWTVADMATAPIQPSFGVAAPRGHGHSAVLLPDGRVLVSGGNTSGTASGPGLAFTGDVYSPPYLFQTFRPGIVSVAGSTFTFGQSISLSVNRLANEIVDAVVLLRPASTCYGFDSSQRYIELDFTLGTYDPVMGTQSVTTSAPNDDLGPTGHYMLFVVSHLSGASAVRVPSVGQFITLN